MGADRRLTFAVTGGATPRLTATDAAGRVHLDGAPATFHPATRAESPVATERLDSLRAELGTPGLGTTLRLLFAVENRDPTRFGGYQWVCPPADAAAADLRLHLDQGGSTWAAVLGAWDEVAETTAAHEGRWLRPWCVDARER